VTTAMQDISRETIELTKQAFAKTQAGLQKAITTGLGLQGYNLEAPSKKLYPVLSPLRNRIARTNAPVGSLAAHWKAIVGINTSNVKAAVPFGTRNTNTITYAERELSAAYKTYGLDDTVDDEAVWLARGFEDVRALSALATLQAVMIEEEKLILAGLSSANALGAAPQPTLTQRSGGGNWGAATNVFVKVVPLSLYGWLNSPGSAYNTNDLTAPLADHGLLSPAASIALTANTYTVDASTTPVNGAFAYAWFVATNTVATDPGDASRYLAAITTVPAASFTAPPSASNLPASAITSDTSGDANAFDGLFPQIVNVGSTLTVLDNSYTSGVLKQVTGPANAITGALVFDMNLANGDGSPLTADGAGGIVEFDAVLRALWDKSRIGPSLIIMNSQEAKNVTAKIAGNATGYQFRAATDPGSKDLIGGLYISGYLNKFSNSAMTPGNPDVVPFLVHPYLPPGTIIFLSERLPYPNNMVPNVLEMEMQQEYADFEWARTQRKYEHGVYANGVLKHYFPAGCAVIRSIKNG
jgi:hypothetical protein